MRQALVSKWQRPPPLARDWAERRERGASDAGARERRFCQFFVGQRIRWRSGRNWTAQSRRVGRRPRVRRNPARQPAPSRRYRDSEVLELGRLGYLAQHSKSLVTGLFRQRGGSRRPGGANKGARGIPGAARRLKAEDATTGLVSQSGAAWDQSGNGACPCITARCVSIAFFARESASGTR